MHYYPHHIGDFIKDTANLDDHQLATYLRLIWAYYTEEKPFEDDCEGIAFAMRSDERTVRLLLKHYFSLEDGKWFHSRCEREIEVFKGKSEKARNSANARWKNATAMRPHSDSNANEPVFDANQEPRTKNQKKIKNTCDQQAESQATIRIPYDEILDSFKTRLPSFPQPRRPLDDDRRKAIRSLWTKKDQFGSVDFFDRYFKHVSESDFLSGWKGCGFDWLMKPANFRKVIEGNYHGETRNA